MDSKTLEYMREKVQKADSLIHRIAKLRELIEFADKTTEHLLRNIHNDTFWITSEIGINVLTNLKQSLKEIAQAEIELLEKELQEL